MTLKIPRHPRSGFTIYEILIAAAIATILTLVLYNTLLSGTRIAGKNMEMLNYLRDASLLMEYIKTDIRNAPKGAQAIAGENPQVMRSIPNGPPVMVSYRFSKEEGIVTRSRAGRRIKSFGRGQSAGKGTIVEFKVTEVEIPDSSEPFYQIVVGFASTRHRAAGHRGGALRVLKSHRVQALVSRRTPAERADKWNTSFIQ
jgi:type II secretory pathway pseudopilin PulG